MAALKLLAKLLAYYAAIAAAIALVAWLVPEWQNYLPIGRVQTLIAESSAGGNQLPSVAADRLQQTGAFVPSLVWLAAAVLGSLLASLPVSWIYMKVRNPHDYDQSLIDTIVVLPLVVTSIVVVVQHSLALSFSLAGIAGAARFRNSLKSSGDLLFILLAIGMGLSAGIGALELAIVTSAAFNLVFIALWASNYGERAEMKRFLSEFEFSEQPNGPPSTVTTTTAAAVVTEVTETFEPRPPKPAKPRRDDDDDD